MAVPELRGLFNDLIRFEIELWNAVDARLKSEFNLPLSHFEPMSVMDRLSRCRVYDIAHELGITTGGTSKLVDRIEASGSTGTWPMVESGIATIAKSPAAPASAGVAALARGPSSLIRPASESGP